MLGVFWNPQDLLLLMGTEIFKIDASWPEKLTKTRGSQRLWHQLYFILCKLMSTFALTISVNIFRRTNLFVCVVSFRVPEPQQPYPGGRCWAGADKPRLGTGAAPTMPTSPTVDQWPVPLANPVSRWLHIFYIFTKYFWPLFATME